MAYDGACKQQSVFSTLLLQMDNPLDVWLSYILFYAQQTLYIAEFFLSVISAAGLSPNDFSGHGINNFTGLMVHAGVTIQIVQSGSKVLTGLL